MEKSVFTVSFFLIYYHISGLATTNILRLTYGNPQPVLASKCFCDKCGTSISPFYQLPIISYIICKGRCKKCNTIISVEALILEITVLTGMFFASAILSYSFLGVTLSFIYYEIVRIIVIFVKGKREMNFTKQYSVAVLAMIPFYLMAMFSALIYKVACI